MTKWIAAKMCQNDDTKSCGPAYKRSKGIDVNLNSKTKPTELAKQD